MNGDRHDTGRIAILLALAWTFSLLPGQAWAQAPAGRMDSLLQLNASVESVVTLVSRSVVQVLVTSYGPVEKGDRTSDLVIGHQRSMGSGVAIDKDGYIMTNAHVVANAKRVQVVLPESANARAPRSRRGRTVDATIVGIANEIDLALLKVSEVDMPAIPIAPAGSVRQGELVFAFGSPEGLLNSVTMGIVSAVARQPDPENPRVYVQTDAPINRGNSGGPLVNVKGELVGLNTFILSDSGGSQGLGFAIPGALVQIAYPKLRRYGHLHRGEMGMLLQTVTPTLAAGLRLPQDWGAMISDVAPGSPADVAGLRVKDIVLKINQTSVEDLPTLALELFARGAGDVVQLRVLRGEETLERTVVVEERPHDFDRLTDFVEPAKSIVAKLGILGVPLSDDTARLGLVVRIPSGVVVVGHTQDESDRPDTGLMAGDTIHAINDVVVTSVPDLCAALDGLVARSAVVLQIERNGQFIFLSFELE